MNRPRTNKNVSIRDALDGLDAQLRAGQINEVVRRIKEVNTAKLPRTMRLPLANLCRRVGLNGRGIRILTPVILAQEKRLDVHATNAELAEYAALLQRCGAVDEAIELLESLDVEKNPETLLFRSYCLFNRWEYLESVPLLESYLESSLPAYARLVGQVNLAAALVACDRLGEAKELLAKSIEEARAGQHRRLEGNCFELRGQVHVLESNVATAKADLEQASRLLSADKSTGGLMTYKWMAVIESMESASPQPLRDFRAEAAKAREWEGVRHADLYELRVRFDEGLFRKLLFGSPWPRYRDRTQRSLSRILDEKTYVHGDPKGRHFDLTTALLDGAPSIKEGSKIHQALEILLRDFYRPINIGSLFSQLYPGERFDIFSSPDRVHQILRRLRDWVETSKLPFKIAESAQAYSVEITGSMAFVVPYERRSVDPDRALISRIREAFAQRREFTVREICSALDLPLTKVRKFCGRAVADGWLAKSGAGNSTLYSLKTGRFF